MNTRLLQFINAENLSQSQFADMIGVARASISHILAGRNKPGYDFIESLMTHFPNLNIDWLVTGRGRMYKNSGSLFDNDTDGTVPSSPAPEPVTVFDTVKKVPEGPAKTDSRVSRIVIFYTDGTFKELDI